MKDVIRVNSATYYAGKAMNILIGSLEKACEALYTLDRENEAVKPSEKERMLIDLQIRATAALKREQLTKAQAPANLWLILQKLNELAEHKAAEAPSYACIVGAINTYIEERTQQTAALPASVLAAIEYIADEVEQHVRSAEQAAA